MLSVGLFLLVFPLELLDELLPLGCLAHPHHHQALVVPLRHHRRLGRSRKHTQNPSGQHGLPDPPQIPLTTPVFRAGSGLIPQKSGEVGESCLATGNNQALLLKC